MKICIHPIAMITSTSGISGDVRLKPLSRYFDEYINQNRLMLGNSHDKSEVISLELITGFGKKRRFKFQGFDSLEDAEHMVGKTLYVQADANDDINLISKNLLGYEIVNINGDSVGMLKDVMWLPGNDVYVIENNKKEYLIPIIPEIVKNINYERKLIIINTMDGLLD